jgi:hypothetical protein
MFTAKTVFSAASYTSSSLSRRPTILAALCKVVSVTLNNKMYKGAKLKELLSA